MRTLVHLSDLHFGRVDEALLAPLIERIGVIAPDVVIVSGDLTQRARSGQFKAARAFLDALPKPQIVVPGNHDIPMHNVVDRFLSPLEKYRRYISDDLEPTYIDGEVAIFGVNTARSATIKGGRINAEQIAQLRSRLLSLQVPVGEACSANRIKSELFKVVVTHHPFDLPARYGEGDLVGHAASAMRMFAECRVDLLLAGHLHASHAGDTAVRYRLGGYSALGVQAGTATSTRGRGEMNSFNVIRIAVPVASVDRYGWDAQGGEFVRSESQTFERNGDAWATRAVASQA